MDKLGLLLIIISMGIIGEACKSTFSDGVTVLPSDTLATEETKRLYERIWDIASRGTMVGHQDDLAYGHLWYNEDGRSDVKDVTGDYPAVVGWEIGDLELGKMHNLDSVCFTRMQKYIKETARRGGITTISWHTNNIATQHNAWDNQQDTIVRTILPGGVHHHAYLGWLSRIGDFFLQLKDENGAFIPVVFRPYHEHTGSWFWWGADQCTAEEYKALWRMTVAYLRETKHIHHLLFCYSPAAVKSEAEFMERYPGDDVVDMVAFDCYVQRKESISDDLKTYKRQMEVNIDIVTSVAEKTRKIAAIGETGLEGVIDTTYFTQTIYPLIKSKTLAWVLFWRNAYEVDKREHYYLPFTGHAAAFDFENFTKKEDVLMNNDL
ncbi:glycoside hydrolase family 26 protein [Sphingobacterium sp. FBM7-1]|uniref:glycoside hydrolase family 26 protein n=1 Tax=Sphingobacterium sp. FBM7-1 TaxID=2886688 RepID=UPI001D0FF87E|nr:glycosyl hydrolase [Sphingobacterium sp. FBM7-1]MCC2600759.1 glycoside hydrolase family 26 protein [Sphingobacterium sp. FBM7-1]